jgi:hypothetical protein
MSVKFIAAIAGVKPIRVLVRGIVTLVLKSYRSVTYAL